MEAHSFQSTSAMRKPQPQEVHIQEGGRAVLSCWGTVQSAGDLLLPGVGTVLRTPGW